MENISLAPVRSTCLMLACSTLHLLVFIALSQTRLDTLQLGFLCLFTGLSFVYQLRRYCLRSGGNFPEELIWQANGDWLVSLSDGAPFQPVEWKLLYRSRRLIILRFYRTDGERITILLCKDSLKPEELRRLLVLLGCSRDSIRTRTPG